MLKVADSLRMSVQLSFGWYHDCPGLSLHVSLTRVWSIAVTCRCVSILMLSFVRLCMGLAATVMPLVHGVGSRALC